MTGTARLRRDLLFVDVDDDGFVLRARGVAAQLLELTAAANLGAHRDPDGDWHAPFEASNRVAAMAAELRAVVLGGAARRLGAAPVTRVEGALVPEPLWGDGPQQRLGDRWEALCAAELDDAEGRCDACGRRGEHLDAQLTFGDDGVASVARLVVLCDGCDLAAHHGRARVTGRESDALLHAMAVNGWSGAETVRRWERDAQLWRERSERDWDLDLSTLT